MSDDYFMELALVQARAAAAFGEVPVGAVVVRNGVVIADGRNAPIDDHDPTAHAEIAALRAAALALGNYRLEECELFVTLEPCAMCSGAMLAARVKRVVFGAAESKTGAAGSVVDLFANKQLNHRTSLRGGVLAEECGAVLKEFFRRRRVEQRVSASSRYPLRDDALRTPDIAFADLPAYPWSPNYLSDLPSLSGLRMHYVDAQGSMDDGGGRSRTYLCHHDIPGWSYLCRKMIADLQQAGHRVVAPDLIGFGKSDKPKKDSFHSFRRHRQILLELVEKLDLHDIVLVLLPGSRLLGLTLPPAAPLRYQGLRIMTTSQLIQSDVALSSGYRLWQESHGPNRDVFAAVAIDNYLNPDESAGEIAAYRAPFPDQGHCAALRFASRISSISNSFNDAGISDGVIRFWSELATC